MGGLVESNISLTCGALNDQGMRPADRPFILAPNLPCFQDLDGLVTSPHLTPRLPRNVIVLDANIASMTKFKQIIGRGTRFLRIGKHRQGDRGLSWRWLELKSEIFATNH